MNYELKDKIKVTEDFLNELSGKCWQEIEYLQAQIANIAESPENEKLQQLFKNLLTSYYIFTGGVETLLSEPIVINTEPVIKQNTEVETLPVEESTLENDSLLIGTAEENNTTEPFEYFVDFDEPTGEPISDEDLYG